MTDVHNENTINVSGRGELGQFNNHLNTDPWPEKQLEGCQYAEITCINNCGKQMQHIDIENHQNEHCPNHSVSCEYCCVYKASTYNDLTQTHWPVCGPVLPSFLPQ